MDDTTIYKDKRLTTVYLSSQCAPQMHVAYVGMHRVIIELYTYKGLELYYAILYMQFPVRSKGFRTLNYIYYILL